MKILITGSNGLLGQKLVAQLLNKKIPFLATSLGENRNSLCPEVDYFTLDIVDADAVKSVVERYRPTHIIHTAAMTNVDACELDPEKCQAINVIGTKNLLDCSLEYNVHLQLLSTDFVFDGEKGNYSETDEVNPLSVYAKSKVDAEQLLLTSSLKSYSIVRTIIVYGTGENLTRSNMFLWAKEALPKGEVMNVVDDQFRAPTWADDLAWGCIRICELNEQGIFHLSGPETFSVLEIVQKVAQFYSFPTDKINRISSKTLNQPAKRPPITGFDLTKAKIKLNYQPKSIEETLPLF